MKTLERIIDIHIRERTEKNLSNAQHAYRKGRSTETALHEVVRYIEKALLFKNYAMATFLDIEGAFNNVNADSILSSLNGIGVEGGIRAWIGAMLTSRRITAELRTLQHKVRYDLRLVKAGKTTTPDTAGFLMR
ncbi:uncharacterized protein [Drosophila kikkawai]|uniref:Reverse transcriptase domain-containing protein n=1 Tax=Drosophila kikkawai TaxID=30033 RepID=A0ABM4GCN3_DROKI